MNDLKIKPEHEKRKIVAFLKKVFKDQEINHAVIGLSGGIDSTVAFYLLKEVLPPENIIVAHLYYFDSVFDKVKEILKQAKIPNENIYHLSIKKTVDEIVKLTNCHSELVSESHEMPKQVRHDSLEVNRDKIRIGNIAARVRMIVLFDLAKKYKALVCGTENKTENLLGYFTRFGDQASDIEPIAHLYKTQVLQLAKYLEVPAELIDQSPTAGLWHGQTDEGQFGFSYAEADQVLFLHLEKNVSVADLEKNGLKSAKKILEWRKKNLFKHDVPYILKK